MIVGMITKLGVVVLYTPVFLPPALVIVSFGIWLGSLYIKTQLSVKREMSNAKAPVLATFGGAIHGLGNAAFVTGTHLRADFLQYLYAPTVRK